MRQLTSLLLLLQYTQCKWGKYKPYNKKQLILRRFIPDVFTI
jgi:hypothetical protein